MRPRFSRVVLRFSTFVRASSRASGTWRSVRYRHERVRLVVAVVLVCSTLAPAAARAQQGDPPSDPPKDPPATNEPTNPNEPVVPTTNPQRASSIVPAVAEPAPAKVTIAVDPVADGAVIVLAGGFALLLDAINSTGEIRPQQIARDFDRSQLLGIDRGAISQNVDPNARMLSNVGLFVAIGYAALDPVLSGIREESVQTALTDAFMYLQATTVTWGLTNLTKIAVRRPRPQAYIDAAANKDDPNYSNADTDSSLSFFSGHASMTASIAATATYLAFARSPKTARPWITLALGTAITTFVCVERVRGGAHFPTDVIAGAVAGAGVGIVIPHIHRSEDAKQRRVWVGFAPQQGGGTVSLTGVF